MLGLLLVLVGIAFLFSAIGQMHVLATMGAKTVKGGHVLFIGYGFMAAGVILEAVRQYG